MVSGGVVTNDSTFAKITAGTVEVLSGTGAIALTVGSNALNAGINTVNVGSSGLTVAASFGTSALTINGSTNTTTFTLQGVEAGSRTIVAGTASDTLVLAGAGAQTLGTVIGVDVITFTSGTSLTLSSAFYQGTTGTTITTGTNASTVVGTGVLSKLSIIGSSSVADTFVGGSASDTLQGWSGSASSLVDSLTGGAGADYFVVGSSAGNMYTGTGYAFITDFGLGDSDQILVQDYTGDTTAGYTFGISGTAFTLTQTSSGSIIAQGNLSGSYATMTAAGLTATLNLIA